MSMEHYKGYIIFGDVSTTEDGRCCSYGLVCMKGPRTVFNSNAYKAQLLTGKEEAEQHGIELRKLWIDKYRSRQ